MTEAVISELAGSGTLRAGINLGNPLLVTGRTAEGDPDGVSPDMARALAASLGVPVTLLQYDSPGAVADGAARGEWDIGLIAIERARTETMTFSPGYVEIEATYLVPAGSPLQTVEEVDRPGIDIAVSERAAYDLYLTRTLQHAELHRAKGIAGAFELFKSQGHDALAGLRPALLDDVAELPGARVLDGRYLTVEQAIGTRPECTAGAAYVRDFVMQSRANGLIASLIDRHGVTGRLQVGTSA